MRQVLFQSLVATLVMCVAHGYIEAVVASVDGASTNAAHTPFVPMVAFKCGFRNQHATTDGKWTSDESADAKCMTGTYDILQYCRKVSGRSLL